MVLALSQSTDPQRQLIVSSFAEVPSVMLHAAYLLHVLLPLRHRLSIYCGCYWWWL